MAYRKAMRFVIRDGGGQYTRTFDHVFTAIGAEPIKTPPGAPQANAFAERWVRTVRHELLDRTLIWNQRQLERLLAEFVDHYNQHRPHRSRNQRAPTDSADASVIQLGQPIQRTTACAGLINESIPTSSLSSEPSRTARDRQLQRSRPQAPSPEPRRNRPDQQHR